MSAKDLKNLLNSNVDSDLGRIVEHARELGELTAALQDGLPARYREAIRAASVREDGELVVVASSSVWAARLRFESDRLLDTARAAGARAERCSVRVGRHDTPGIQST